MKYFYLLSSILLFSNAFAQIGTISNQYCIGGSDQDRPVEEAFLNNGNRIVLMTSNSMAGFDKLENSRGVNDFWLLCLNANDEILWQRTIGGNCVDEPFGLMVTADQSIYACGTTCSSPSGEQTYELFGSWDAWLIKLKPTGDLIWAKNYGGTESDYFMDLTELSSGNILVAGQSKSGISGNKTSINYGQEDIWILKLDPNGEILTDASIGGSDIDQEPMIIQPAPNQLKIAAMTYSGISGLKTDSDFGIGDIWMLDLDTNFNIIHQKTFGGSNEDKPTDLLWNEQGKLILLAESSSNQSGNKTENNYGLIDNWILKLDANFEIEQQKTIGSEGYDFNGKLIEYPNGNLCVLANSTSDINVFKTEPNIGETDLWLYTLNPNFNLIADKTIGTNRTEHAISLRLNPNASELHVLAWSNGDAVNDKTCPTKGDHDYWGFQMNASLDLNNTQIDKPISIYPNPTSDFITIENNDAEPFLSIELLDYAGKRIKSFNPSNTSVNLSDLAPGVYLLRMTTAEGNFCEKIRLE
jgi:hypothetical protein